MTGLKGGFTKPDSLKGTFSNPVSRGYSAYDIAKACGFVGTEMEWLESLRAPAESLRVSSLNEQYLAVGKVVEAVGSPAYISDLSEYEEYGLTEPGWYVFARITAPIGAKVTADTTVNGAAGYIAEEGGDHIDVAVRFEVAAASKMVIINWGDGKETFVFRDTDLAVRNLDYRVTFYVYDADSFAKWSYKLATGSFAAETHYFVVRDGSYTPAEVTAGETIPNYFVHSKLTFEGMVRNVTYNFNQTIDCPVEFILPEVTDEEHGFWFEIRCLFEGTYSMTLVPPSADVKIATEHTQQEQKGINMINLLYTSVAGAKVWRFMNTRSTIPA